MMLVVVALLFGLVVPLVRGADQASKTQTASDSAALAGAKAVREKVLGTLDDGDLSVLTGGLGGSLGGDAAGSYAYRNGASLRSYRYDAWADEVVVEVRHRDPGIEGVDPAERPARASVGVAFGRCSLSTIETTPTPPPTPEPTSTDEPTATPEPTTPPPPTYEHSLTCPGVHLTGYDSKRELARAAADALRGRLEPRLVR